MKFSAVSSTSFLIAGLVLLSASNSALAEDSFGATDDFGFGPCEDLVFDYFECVEGNCESCLNDIEADDDDDNAPVMPSCEDFNKDLCYEVNCCPKCYNEVEALGECYWADEFPDAEKCDFECSSTPGSGASSKKGGRGKKGGKKGRSEKGGSKKGGKKGGDY
mmetsp:Transcript_16549/g.27446  ORF Transcript_16549/g.27446 Transcript_16549/m.27446 type:complete len:163 (+) Transcript_16549:38-526(+)|eukprot:CAMPEP_0119014470 /NCGR_PEP_ID=MMETSP1176-20130426/9812_1 /TAXON_ID=265551 /ORGANISM="Synedropsis recta cf, Strain CCMP1620" /LENGTH=162 /DNA_ID=CAMNT_0006967659 /DNA_START=34 /DNA_END=522 /DNA_ORIENTATION=-